MTDKHKKSTLLSYNDFNSFLKNKFGQRVQKLTIDAGLTCPHRDSNKLGGCIYCNDLGSGTGATNKDLNIKHQIENQIVAMKRKYSAKAFIAYFQSYTNTYAPVSKLKNIYDNVLEFPEIVGLSIGTRPDCINDEILSLISSYTDKRIVWMEYGLQSSNDETLKKINRGHDTQAFIDAIRMTVSYPLRICAHIIIGLPGEGFDDFINTARFVSSLPITDIKIHLMYVIKNTPMEAMFNDGSYTPMSMGDYVKAASYTIAALREDIVIQRITGDPHRDELIAPQWAMQKTIVRNAINDFLLKEGLYQGIHFLTT